MYQESIEERRFREMKEIEMMMEQARFKAALQKLNEQRTGQSATAAAVAGVGGGSIINKIGDNTENGYVENGYVENYFE